MSAPDATRDYDSDYDRWVEDFAAKHREKPASRQLMAAGAAATAALRRGLRHPDPAVRVGCCKVLDHYLDEDAVPELVENLEHPHPEVRAWALHALACERCKQGDCRPAEDEIVPKAARILRGDENRHVRQMAANLLGPMVHRAPEALRALEHARDHDGHPAVRKVAHWFTPGGPRFERSKPQAPRVPRRDG